MDLTTLEPLILPLVFGVVGAVLLFLALLAYFRVQRSRSWPQTTGIIMASGVEARESTSSEGGTSTSYHLAVVYDYDVGGQRYRSGRIDFGGSVGGGYRRAQKRAAMYPAGGSVPVYYDPANPASAVLERRAPGAAMFVLFGAVMSGVMLVLILRAVGLVRIF